MSHDPYGMGEPDNSPPDHLIEEANEAADLRREVDRYRESLDAALALKSSETGRPLIQNLQARKVLEAAVGE